MAWWSEPQGQHLPSLRQLTCVDVQRSSHMQPLVLGWGLPKITSKNREIKAVLIKSHTGTGGPEGPCHLPAALIVNS